MFFFLTIFFHSVILLSVYFPSGNQCHLNYLASLPLLVSSFPCQILLSSVSSSFVFNISGLFSLFCYFRKIFWPCTLCTVLGPTHSTALFPRSLKAWETKIVMKPLSGFATEFPHNQEGVIKFLWSHCAYLSGRNAVGLLQVKSESLKCGFDSAWTKPLNHLEQLTVGSPCLPLSTSEILGALIYFIGWLLLCKVFLLSSLSTWCLGLKMTGVH